jgi:hypothetical protein
MSDGVMTTMRPAPSLPRESSLKAEAATVERLRRQIAEMPARGEVATPQLLADFARAQKSYLDKKIVFEKERRMAAERDAQGIVVEEATVAAAPSEVALAETAKSPELASVARDAAPSGSNLPLAIAAIVIVALAVVAWYYLTR